MLDTVNNVCWRSAGPARQASDFLLLVRRACATGLACHCRQYFRWIPSEGNPADAPSRVYDRGKVGDKSTGLFITRISASTLVRGCTMSQADPSSAHINHAYRRLPWLPLAPNLLLSVPSSCVDTKESPHVG